MDSYQAIYDATRSRINPVDSSDAIQSAIRDLGLGDYAGNVAYEFQNLAIQLQQLAAKPSIIYKPKLSIDGNQWCALYGDNLQEGVCGFGDSPAEAMKAFDDAWHEKLSTPEIFPGTKDALNDLSIKD